MYLFNCRTREQALDGFLETTGYKAGSEMLHIPLSVRIPPSAEDRIIA